MSSVTLLSQIVENLAYTYLVSVHREYFALGGRVEGGYYKGILYNEAPSRG